MKFILSFSLLIFSCALFSSCKKSSSSTYTSTYGPTGSTTKGTVVFWTPDATIGSCGVTIHLSNGDQSLITAPYPIAPPNCSGAYGGYFNVDPGNYTYTVTSTGSCTIAGGSVSIATGSCNYVKVL